LRHTAVTHYYDNTQAQHHLREQGGAEVYTEHGEPYASNNTGNEEADSAVTSPQAVLRRPLIDATSSRSDDSYDNSPTQAGTGGARSSTNSLSKFNYNTPPPDDSSNEGGMFSSASARSRRGSLLAKTPSGNTATTGSIGTVPLSTFNTGDSKDAAASSSGAATTADTSTATDSNSGSRIRQSVGSSAAASPAYF
jgi:hypothetical protein